MLFWVAGKIEQQQQQQNGCWLAGCCCRFERYFFQLFFSPVFLDSIFVCVGKRNLH
jgi:hypothetical protein